MTPISIIIYRSPEAQANDGWSKQRQTVASIKFFLFFHRQGQRRAFSPITKTEERTGKAQYYVNKCIRDVHVACMQMKQKIRT